jgi:hypothetical protein
VRNAAHMAVLKAFSNLFDYSFRVIFLESSIWLLLEVAMQGSTTNIVHHQNNILLCIDDLEELHNMLIFHLLHKLDFPFDRLSAVRFFKFVFLVYFESNLLVLSLVKANPDNGIRTLANLLSNDIVIETGLF